MPVYSYRCDNCGVQFDRQQKFSDPVLKKCPECGKSALHKIYTPVGIVFKGSGFYATDHRSPSGTASHASAKTEEKSESPKSAEKSESTTTPTTPSKSE